ncbi:unnamed protein product [Cyprideis torosa]|uniref:Uncharacterized protein n=1 Tax=Cyprideis torosa TaxID=163714 RepID=A0A7R8WFJ9_9CRUS|nr:unnamed protein product [Cyprideis torosa]CAG0895506.1 unnamed protein product [Cyprideis torosa]
MFTNPLESNEPGQQSFVGIFNTLLLAGFAKLIGVSLLPLSLHSVNSRQKKQDMCKKDSLSEPMATPIPRRVIDYISKYAEEKNNSEILPIILLFLSKEHENPRYIQTLETCLDLLPNREPFDKVVECLLSDITKANQDEDYRKVMGLIWSTYILPHEEAENGLDFELILRNEGLILETTTVNFITTVSKLPPEQQRKIIGVICTAGQCLSNASGGVVALRDFGSKALSVIERGANKVVGIGLAAVYLTWEALKSIYHWCTGEISGKRCVKNILDSVSSVSAGVGGGLGGAALAGFVVPNILLPGWGSAIAIGASSIIGGVLCAKAVELFSDWALRQLFSLPKHVAVENAYRWMELSCDSSNPQINTRFRELCLRHHPDKGGSYENWHKLQVSMGLIKISKGEIAG